MTNPETLIRPSEKPTLINRLLSFVIFFFLFVILDRLFDFVVPSWHRSFWESALAATIFGLLMALFRPHFLTPVLRPIQYFSSKNKLQ